MQPKTNDQPESAVKYSLGTDNAVTAILQQLATRDNVYDTILINVQTLIRNRLQKDLTINEIFTAVRNELHELVQDIVEQFQAVQYLKHPLIILYLADYERMIPLSLLRAETETKIQMNTVRAKIMAEMVKANHLDFMAGNVKIIQLPVSSKMLIHKVLLHALHQNESTSACLMFSHCPIDFHTARFLPKFRIVESYTGKLVAPLDLGEKVLKNKSVPFNAATHAVLGDSYFIKSLLSTKQKREIYALAEKEKWNFTTPMFVRDSLIAAGFTIPIDFS